jgi:serine/threonine protein kinase
MGCLMSVRCKPKRVGDFSLQSSTTSTKITNEVVDASTVKHEQEPINEHSFQISHLIDTGGFGFVFKATKISTNTTYALKVQPMEFMVRLSRAGGTRAVNKNSLHIERNTLIDCRGHPFIVNIEYAFRTQLYAVLAMEYIPGGTLSRLVLSHGTLPIEIAKIYTAEIALALNYMHNKGIIYRDVKPSNVLICLDGHIKITDFGLAGSLVVKKKQVNPQESMLESTHSDEDDQSTRDEDSASSEEPEISEDENDDIQGDLRRIRRRTLCGTAGFRPPEQVGERYVDYYSRSGYDEKAGKPVIVFHDSFHHSYAHSIYLPLNQTTSH